MKKRTIAWWTFGGVMFGVSSALLTGSCMLGVFVVLPGALLASALGYGGVFSEIITCRGARLDILVPANAAVYGVIGAMVGLLISIRRTHTDGLPRCTKCGYLLVGNTSGICPECGTAFDMDSIRTPKPPEHP